MTELPKLPKLWDYVWVIILKLMDIYKYLLILTLVWYKTEFEFTKLIACYSFSR